MSVKIKLIRTGRKKSPSYRIVAAEQRRRAARERILLPTTQR